MALEANCLQDNSMLVFILMILNLEKKKNRDNINLVWHLCQSKNMKKISTLLEIIQILQLNLSSVNPTKLCQRFGVLNFGQSYDTLFVAQQMHAERNFVSEQRHIVKLYLQLDIWAHWTHLDTWTLALCLYGVNFASQIARNKTDNNINDVDMTRCTYFFSLIEKV